MVVSGGHTSLFYVESYTLYEILGSTRDDAAGEAFDKIASMLGLNYPGGPEIDKLSKTGNPAAYSFPRSMIDSSNFDFSFSGIKTSVKYFLAGNFPEGAPTEVLPDICASVQRAIVDVLVKKAIDAARQFRVSSIVVSGGVSANSDLRSQMKLEAGKKQINVVTPDINYCMDNAAMIGFIASMKFAGEEGTDFNKLDFVVKSNSLRARRK